MAQARTERIGTIFSRTQALLQYGAKSEAEKPVWFEIYKAFPPKYEPKFSRTLPKTEIRNILYQEDIIRHKFHKEYPRLSVSNMLKASVESPTQRFLSLHKRMRIENKEMSDEQLYKITVQMFFKVPEKKGSMFVDNTMAELLEEEIMDIDEH